MTFQASSERVCVELFLATAHKIYHLHTHHDFTLLIQNFDKGAHDAAVGTGFGPAPFHHGRAHGEFIAGNDRLVPAEFVAAGRTEVSDLGEIVFGVEAHHEGRGVPTAGNDAAVDALLRCFFIDVIGERHVAPAKLEHFLFVDADGAEFVYGAGDVILEIPVFGR